MIQQGCRWRPSDRSPKSRVAGKLEIHRRLKLDEKTQQPSLKVFSNCRNLLRTLPALPVDKSNPEDVDTNAEDHAYDALRYGCMSRPMHPYHYESSQRFYNTVEKFTPADETFGY